MRKLIAQNTITFCVVVFCLSLSTFGILFYAGYIYEVSQERQISKGDKITLSVNEQVSGESIKQIIETLGRGASVQSVMVASAEPVQTGDDYPLVGEYNALFQNRLLSGRCFDRDENKPIIILPEYMVSQAVGYNTQPIGERIKIGNDEFTIAGIVSFLSTDYFITPVDYYIDHYPVRYIEVTYDIELSKSSLAAISEYIGKNNGIITYKIDKPHSVLLTFSFWSEFGQILLIFSVVIINIFAIVFFWIRRSKLTYNIYSIIGGSRSRILRIIAGQSVIIIAFSILVGSALFYVFSDALAKMNMIISGKPSFYLLTVAIEFFITFCFSAVSARKANQNNEIYYVKE